MAQPNFAAISSHVHSIGNEVDLVPNMILAAVQQTYTNHLQTVALFSQVQGQIGQM